MGATSGDGDRVCEGPLAGPATRLTNVRRGSALPAVRCAAYCNSEASLYPPAAPISDKDIDEFIAICEEEHGVRLTKDEAIVRAKRLTLLYELVVPRQERTFLGGPVLIGLTFALQEFPEDPNGLHVPRLSLFP